MSPRRDEIARRSATALRAMVERAYPNIANRILARVRGDSSDAWVVLSVDVELCLAEEEANPGTAAADEIAWLRGEYAASTALAEAWRP